MIVKEELLIDNLIIYQDTDLYRFTSDSILLSRFATAKRGEFIADLCSGSGIVGLHYLALNKDKNLTVDLYEMQDELYSLSKRSIEENNLADVVTANKKNRHSCSGAIKKFRRKFLCLKMT